MHVARLTKEGEPSSQLCANLIHFLMFYILNK